MPPARRWPLAELIDACRRYSETLRRRVFFEWALIDGQNDGPEQAHALGRLLQGLAAHVNLIPLGGPARITATTGLEWPLNDETLPFGPARGVSNRLIAAEATVRLASGVLLCIHARAY